MGFLSKRKAKKEAKKAEANAAQAAADGTAAAEAVAKKEAAVKVPGEIKIQHQRGAQSGNKQQRLKKHQSSGGKAIAFRRRILGQGGAKPAPIRSRPPRSPGGQSHVSAITRDTAFPETPKRMLFSPSSNLLPDNDYDDYTDEEDDVGGGVVIAGRWSGDKITTASVPSSIKEATTDAKKKKTGNMWTRSKNFKKLTDWAFKTIDADGSGQVDKKELYTGLLMIHLKLATYAGPAACRPATREYCEKIFDQMDVDKSGELDREEFTEVMQIVCAQVFTRVTIQWTMTLMIVPMIAQGIWKAFVAMNESAWDFWMEIDELDPMRATVSNVAGSAWDKVLSITPGFVQTAMGMTVGKIDDVWAQIPEGIKETIPVTLVSCILSCLLVPYMIYKMDEYHEQKAAKKGKALKQEKGIKSSIVQK